jgi:hypothetical protein
MSFTFWELLASHWPDRSIIYPVLLISPLTRSCGLVRCQDYHWHLTGPNICTIDPKLLIPPLTSLLQSDVERPTSPASPSIGRRRTPAFDTAVDIQAVVCSLHGSGHEYCEACTIVRQSLLNGPSALPHVVCHLCGRHHPRAHCRNQAIIIGSTRPPPHLLESVRPKLRDELRCTESFRRRRGSDGPNGSLDRSLRCRERGGRGPFEYPKREQPDRSPRRRRSASKVVRLFTGTDNGGWPVCPRPRRGCDNPQLHAGAAIRANRRRVHSHGKQHCHELPKCAIVHQRRHVRRRFVRLQRFGV